MLSHHRVAIAVGVVVLVFAFTACRQAVRPSEPTGGNCPLPAGASPLADPRVTAQQVETGTASLREFALAAREAAKAYEQQAMTVEQGYYFGCLVRQEGPWRSGSTYVAIVTPDLPLRTASRADMRISVHAKDMSFAGRLLHPAIFRNVMGALGVAETDLNALPDPEAGRRILRTLAQEPEAAFDATAPIPGVSPGFAGASGHVAVYNSPLFGGYPFVLFTGFDIDSSHLVEEDIVYLPTVTAKDVVDRETLKAFVTEAGNHVVSPGGGRRFFRYLETQG